MAYLGALVDDFADGVIDPALWPGSYGVVSEVGGRARVGCTVTQWSAYATDRVHTWAGGPPVSVQVWAPAPGGATDTAYVSLLIVTATAGTDAGILVDVVSSGAGAYLGCLLRVGYADAGAVYVPYDPVAHARWQIVEESGTVRWETSPDGNTWTVHRTEPAPAWAADTDLGLVLEAHRASGIDDYAEYDNLGAPVVSGAGTGRLLAGAGLSAGSVRVGSGAGRVVAGGSLAAGTVRVGAGTGRAVAGARISVARPSGGALTGAVGVRALSGTGQTGPVLTGTAGVRTLSGTGST